MPNLRKSKRQKVIDYLFDLLVNLEDLESGDKVFRTVIKKDSVYTAEDTSAALLPIASLCQGKEETLGYIHPLVEKALAVYIQFRFPVIPGIDAEDAYTYYLAVIQKGLLPDYNLGGLAISFLEEENMPELDEGTDVTPGGTMTFTIRYRHAKDDPFEG